MLSLQEFILGDFNRLKQVFINLIKNSVESFDKDEKIVDVKIMDKNKYISVLISDNGCGMQKDELKQVGTMFYSTKDNGTGIGVSFSKDIIEKHHGKITYYSKYGKGTQVEVLLPKINI